MERVGDTAAAPASVRKPAATVNLAKAKPPVMPMEPPAPLIFDEQYTHGSNFDDTYSRLYRLAPLSQSLVVTLG